MFVVLIGIGRCRYCRKCRKVGTRRSCACAIFVKTTEIPPAAAAALNTFKQQQQQQQKAGGTGGRNDTNNSGSSSGGDETAMVESMVALPEAGLSLASLACSQKPAWLVDAEQRHRKHAAEAQARELSNSSCWSVAPGSKNSTAMQQQNGLAFT